MKFGVEVRPTLRTRGHEFALPYLKGGPEKLVKSLTLRGLSDFAETWYLGAVWVRGG